jgi:hypothetical protein
MSDPRLSRDRPFSALVYGLPTAQRFRGFQTETYRRGLARWCLRAEIGEPFEA